jgi:geranylgeranyl pyrophosphate synthase
MDLARIFEPVRKDMEAVDVELQALMRNVGEQALARRRGLGILDRIVQHPFTVPGKRIRPALVLLAAGAARAAGSGLKGTDHHSLISLAAAVEVLHAASLVHDDIIDNADSRRHQVSLNRRFGNRVAVLAGDILYTHFFSLITGLRGIDAEKRFRLLDVFLDTTKAMCMGEILAQEAAASGRPYTFEEYLEVSTDKTAVLFSACCRTAGILCDLAEPQLVCLAEFGLNFGLTFQMADDLVDKDHGLDPRVDLKAATLQYAEQARGGIGWLSEGPHRDSLRDLTEYVIASAIP